MPAPIIVASCRVKITTSSRLRTPGFVRPNENPFFEMGAGDDDGPDSLADDAADAAGAGLEGAERPPPFSLTSTGVRLRRRSSATHSFLFAASRRPATVRPSVPIALYLKEGIGPFRYSTSTAASTLEAALCSTSVPTSTASSS